MEFSAREGVKDVTALQASTRQHWILPSRILCGHAVDGGVAHVVQEAELVPMRALYDGHLYLSGSTANGMTTAFSNASPDEGSTTASSTPTLLCDTGEMTPIQT